jgi:excisionase family DNA binding protein
MRLYTVSEVAHKIGRTPETVRRLTNDGELSCARTSSGVRVFSERDVEHYLAKRERTAAAAPSR